MKKIIAFIDLTRNFLEQYFYAVKDMWCDETKHWNLNYTSFKGDTAEKDRDEFIKKITLTQNEHA